jgi:cytochrome c
MQRTFNSLLFTGFLILLAACGGAGSASPQPTAGASTAAPTQPAADAPIPEAIVADTSFSSRGDATRGEQVYVRCSVCHATTSAYVVGPGMAGLFSANGPILPNGVDYAGKLPNGAERTETNIAAWILEGGRGKIGLMPPQPMSDQEMADLMAYLRTLTP